MGNTTDMSLDLRGETFTEKFIHQVIQCPLQGNRNTAKVKDLQFKVQTDNKKYRHPIQEIKFKTIEENTPIFRCTVQLNYKQS